VGVAEGDAVERLTKLGVDVDAGMASVGRGTEGALLEIAEAHAEKRIEHKMDRNRVFME